MSITQLAKRGLKFTLYGAALAAPILVVAVVNARSAIVDFYASARPFTAPQIAPPPYDQDKPTVVVLASNNGTEITDLLAPYAVFAAAEAFNVYTAAPERTFTPFMWGGVDFVPHYSFAEMDSLLQKQPDVIVIPFIKDPDNAEIIDYIRTHAGPNTVVVSICGGAYVLAATGLVDDGKVTTHTGVFPLIAERYPQIELVHGVRWTDNGKTITSAGITAGIDASLHTIDRLVGRAAALETAARLHYPHTQFLDDPAYVLPGIGAAGLIMGYNIGFAPGRPKVGVYLPEGVDEMDLTATLDTYGRSFAATVHTFAAERTVIRSRFGLNLVPRDSAATISNIRRLIVPGSGLSRPEAARLEQWAQNAGAAQVEYLFDQHTGGSTFAFDITLSDFSRWLSQGDAQYAANGLEYPIEHVSLSPRQMAAERWAVPAVLGAAGVVLVALLKRWSGRREAAKPDYADSGAVTSGANA